MKPESSQYSTDFLNKLITALAISFVVVSFVTFYLVSVLELDGLFVHISQGVLIGNFVFIAVLKRVFEEEKRKMKELSSYTFFVTRN